MKTPPRIETARVTGDLKLEIGWSTGETLPVDLSDLAQPPFDALRTPDFFARMTRDEWGHGLDWPDGLGLGADRLYELSAGRPACRRPASSTTGCSAMACRLRAQPNRSA